jgi:hypothetical protein
MATTARVTGVTFSVRQWRGFLCGGFAWTIYVELEGGALDDGGTVGGAGPASAWTRCWQWITDNITPVPDNSGAVLTPGDTSRPDAGALGANLEAYPDAYTAERLAYLVFDAIDRELGLRVESVKVLRQRLAGHADDTTEATVRPSRALTEAAALAMLRRFASLNNLAYWPRH